MAERVQPTDLELAALISSKICHDLIGPVGNINNGLEILDEEDDVQSRNYALDVIRNVTETASARLQFARFAFGATDSAGAKIDLGTAESLSRGLIGNGKHRLAWHGLKGQIAKDKAKLLLNLVAVAPTAVPRGGDIDVEIAGTPASPGFIVRCSGPSARPPQYLGDFVNGTPPPVTALTIQAYYTVRLAAASRMRLGILKDGGDVVLTAKPEPAAREHASGVRS
jgi:histidine phosphotransferase ChpT